MPAAQRYRRKQLECMRRAGTSVQDPTIDDRYRGPERPSGPRRRAPTASGPDSVRLGCPILVRLGWRSATGQLVAAPAGRERPPRPVVGSQGKRSVDSSRRARANPADRFPSDLLDEAVRSPRSRGWARASRC